MNDNTVKFTAELDCEKGHIETSYDSNENLADVCYFVDNVCARLQELKSMATVRSIEQYDEGDQEPQIMVNVVPPREQSFIDASNDVGVPPREQFFIDCRKIETLRRPDGSNYVRCIVRLKKNEDVYIVHELELNEELPFEHAKFLIIADVDKHVTYISEQLHMKLLNGEYVSQEPVKIMFSIPPWDQFFIDPNKIETLSAPDGTSNIRCIVRLIKNTDVYIVRELELDTDTDFVYAVKLLIADVDKHASSISKQLHEKAMNGECIS